MEPMAVIPVRGLGMAGLIRDIRGHERTFQTMSTATNVRFEDGAITTISQPTPVDELTLESTPIYAKPFILADKSGGHVIVYQSQEIWYYDSTGTGREITPASTPTSGGDWYATQVNEIFVITNGIDVPYQIIATEITDGSSILIPMLNWDTDYRCGLLDNYKNYLVAGQITLSGENRPSMVKWSHPLSPGDTQFYWDHTDPTLLAGENELTVAGRTIEAFQQLRDDMIIYFDQSMWKMTEVGGALLFNWSKVFGDDGIVGKYAHCTVGGKAVVFGNRTIYMHDGFNKQSISDKKITRYLYGNFEIRNDIQLMYYPQREEVYMLLRSKSERAEADRAIIWAASTQGFTVMNFPGPNNNGGAKRMYLGPKFDREIVTYEGAEAAGWTYENSGSRSYGVTDLNDDDLSLYVLSQESSTLATMDVYDPDAHDPTKVLIEFDKIDLEPPMQTTGDKMKFITRLYPQATGQGTLEMAIGVSVNTEAGIYWYPYVNYDIGKDFAIDLRASGRYMSFRVRLPVNETRNFSLSGFDLEMIVPHAGRH